VIFCIDATMLFLPILGYGKFSLNFINQKNDQTNFIDSDSYRP
jgi:hypothetical protein